MDTYESIKKGYLQKQAAESVKSVDADYVNSFLTDAKNFVNAQNTALTGANWASSTDAAANTARSDTLLDLTTRADMVGKYLDVNKSNMKEEDYNTFRSAVDAYKNNFNYIDYAGKENEKYYSQFATQQDYDKYLDDRKAAEEKRKLLERLDQVDAEYDQKWYAWNDAVNNGGIVGASQSQNERAIAEFENIQQTRKDLLAQVTEKDRYDWEGLKMSQNAAKDKNFQSYAAKGAAAENPKIADVLSGTINAGWLGSSAKPVNKVTYTRDNWDAYQKFSVENASKNPVYANLDAGAYGLYDLAMYMTEDEVNTYNYYLGKDLENGTNQADQYLKYLEEELNGRKGTAIGQKLSVSPMYQLGYAAVAGLDQFGQGIKNLVSMFSWDRKGNYVPTSSAQVTGAIAREGLKDVSIPYYNWKTGQQENIMLGENSIGQAAYDAIQSGVNMLPSIIVSTAVGVLNPAAGAAVGGALLGASAAGNAYQEKIQAGWTQSEARSYGLMVGASEAALETVLGAVGSAVGGGLKGLLGKVNFKAAEKIGKVIEKAAKTAGGKIALDALGEGVEEGIQSILEPYFARVVAGEEFTFDMEETLYSALLGAFMGAGFGAANPNTYQGNIQKTAANDGTVPKAETPEVTAPSVNATVPDGIATPTVAATPSQQTDALANVEDLLRAAKPDPVADATKAFKESGIVSNAKAEAILASPEALQQLTEQTGIPIEGTKSQQRVAVKEAVAKLNEQKAEQIGAVPVAEESAVAEESSVAPVETVPEEVEQPIATTKSAPSPNESVGADPAGFGGEFTRMQMEYGNLKEGENPVRPDDMPRSTDGKDRVSHTAVNVKGAKVTPDEFVPLLDKDVTEGGMSYIPITNSKTVQKAMEKISNTGWAASVGSWREAVESGKTGADMVAMGSLLLNNAAAAGNKDLWLDLLHDFQRLGTNTAQGLQAFRILKTLEPSDKLYMVEKSIDQLIKETGIDIKVDQNVLEAYRSAQTVEEQDALMGEIIGEIADQLPTSFIEKFNSLRYVNMLGNLRTQFRNVLGNVGMGLVATVKDKIETTIEMLASKASGGKVARTKSFTVSKEQRAAANAYFDEVKSAVLGEARYDVSGASTSSSDLMRQAQKRKRIFGKNDPKNVLSKYTINLAMTGLEKYREATSWAMEKGDMLFSKPAFTRAFSGYLKAKGETATDYSKIDPKLMNEATLYAIKEAQERTFRDNNAFSDMLSKFGRGKKAKWYTKAVTEGLLPFRKTPANVLVRATEYSPIGFINATIKTIKADTANSDISWNDAINSWAKFLTGTGAFMLGMLFHNMGWLTGSMDEDDPEDQFAIMNGQQEYSIRVPGTNYSITIDWLSPIAIPMLMGAELDKLTKDGGFEWKDIESSLTSITEPLVQMSMLQGVNDTLENVRYADSSLAQIVINSGLNYLTQGLTNTALGQIERAFEDSRMTTYVDENSALPNWLQRAVGKASAKIPGLDYNQIPYINAWGEEEENPPVWAGLLENTTSPGYIAEGKEDDVSRELIRLYKATGVNVFPRKAEKKLTINGQERALSAEENAKLAKTQGQTARKLVESMVESDDYQNLSNAMKQKAISAAYDLAREIGRSAAVSDYEKEIPKYISERPAGMSEAEAIVLHSVKNYIDQAISGLVEGFNVDVDPGAVDAKLDEAYAVFGNMSDAVKNAMLEEGGRVKYFLSAKSAGVSTDAFGYIYQRFYGISSETSKASVKAQQFASYLEKLEAGGAITEEQKAVIKNTMKFYNMSPADTVVYDRFVESGVEPENADYIIDLFGGLTPEEGYTSVRPVQKYEAIAGAEGFTEEEKIAAMKAQITDEKLEAKFDTAIDRGYDTEDFANAYRANSENKKKNDFKNSMMEMGYTAAQAMWFYNLYHGK